MPYFVYKISEMPIRQLKKLEQHDKFSEASNRAKQLRAELASSDTPRAIKVIFAENELHAEDLLNEVRTPQPNPEDD
jgi:hypothetical protein